MSSQESVKVKVALNDPDLPRAESLNAFPLGRKKFRVENVPFYARDLSLGDIVECSELNGELWVKRRVGRSGNGTIRIYSGSGFEAGPGQEVVQALRSRGFIFEFLRGTLAAGVIPEAFDDLPWLESFLGERTSDTLFYEIPDW